MVDRLDYELRAIEADNHAETATRGSSARKWRDIAQGYRLLSDFLASAEADQQRSADEHTAAKKRSRMHPAGARRHPQKHRMPLGQFAGDGRQTSEPADVSVEEGCE